jgi:hypothetical protein
VQHARNVIYNICLESYNVRPSFFLCAQFLVSACLLFPLLRLYDCYGSALERTLLKELKLNMVKAAVSMAF